MRPVHWKMLGKINTTIEYFNKKLNNKSISFNYDMQRKTEFFACFVVSELKKIYWQVNPSVATEEMQ